jgi:hypothetical protein
MSNPTFPSQEWVDKITSCDEPDAPPIGGGLAPLPHQNALVSAFYDAQMSDLDRAIKGLQSKGSGIFVHSAAPDSTTEHAGEDDVYKSGVLSGLRLYPSQEAARAASTYRKGKSKYTRKKKPRKR